jgi:hypothetical protein
LFTYSLPSPHIVVKNRQEFSQEEGEKQMVASRLAHIVYGAVLPEV